MPNTGIMASSVVTSAAVDVLLEPFNNFTDAPWSAGTATIAAGRTGTAASRVGSGDGPVYTIPAISESATVTLGFAYRVTSIAANRHVVSLRTDTNTINHVTLRVTTAGALSVLSGGTTGSILGTSTTGLIAINTWYYLELGVVVHDTTGSATVRHNNTPVLTLTNVDTRQAGTKATVDTIALIAPGSAVTALWDDLYLSTGGISFKGDITI